MIQFLLGLLKMSASLPSSVDEGEDEGGGLEHPLL